MVASLEKFTFVVFYKNPDSERSVVEMKGANILVQKEWPARKMLSVILNITESSLWSQLYFLVSVLIKVIADTLIIKLH